MKHRAIKKPSCMKVRENYRITKSKFVCGWTQKLAVNARGEFYCPIPTMTTYVDDGHCKGKPTEHLVMVHP